MLKITSKQLAVTDSIREKIDLILIKLEKHNVVLINPHFIITKENKTYKVEASIKIPNGELFASATHDDLLYSAISSVGQKLEKQMNRQTHKQEANRHNVLDNSDLYDSDYEDGDGGDSDN